MGMEINPIEIAPQIQPGLMVGPAGVGKRPCIYDEHAVCHAPQKFCYEMCKNCVRAVGLLPEEPTVEPTKNIFHHIKNAAVSFVDFFGI
jgi:hypothetical protein